MKNKLNYNQLISLIKTRLKIAQKYEIIISEKKIPKYEIYPKHQTSEQHNKVISLTDVQILISQKKTITYTFNKKASEITIDDIESLNNYMKKLVYKQHPILGRLFRLFGWWVIFSSSLSLFSVCPICGQPGCAVGALSTGILAGFFAFIKMFLKDFVNSLKRFFSKILSVKK